ncbi:hypothetical protein [Nocardia carnea]|uniref:hypothetical protein n=1 Tax=Nocardia carnea TaxID=37328 RepID=UPI002453CF8F|nr:hypothetical protein [Nocardia carnea]
MSEEDDDAEKRQLPTQAPSPPPGEPAEPALHEALRRSSSELEADQVPSDEAPIEAGLTALDALHTTVELLRATDSAEPATVLPIAFRALSLTTTANTLIHEALLDAEFEVYSPGENFLDDARQQHLDLAVQWLASTLPPLSRPPRSHRVSTLAPPETAPQEYWPEMYDDGLIYPPDSTDKARQLLLFRTHSVALANKSVWIEVHSMLGRVRDPQQRRACRVAALLVDEVLHSDPGGARGDIGKRVLAIMVGRRNTGELVADHRLMGLLRDSVAAAAQPNSWSPISAVSAALEHADPDWMPQRWGYTCDIKLIAATKQFSIRRLPRKGQQVIEVRTRRRAAQRL